MTCEMALERMLDAEPTELRGEADTELARHVRGCGRCAAVAGAILEELHVVSDAVMELAGAEVGPEATRHAAADSATDAVLKAVREAGDGEVVPLRRRRPTGAARRGSGRAGRPRGPRLAPWSRAAWVPLAAAAAAAAVLLFRAGDPWTNTLPPGGGQAPPPIPEPRVSVTPPADRAAAIMETENPDITIVWLYEREES